MRTTTIRTLAFAVAALVAGAAAADGEWRFGLRATLDWSDGEPIGDILSSGLFATRDMDGGWTLGLAADFSTWDAEHPAESIGITQDPAFETVDAAVQQIDLSVWMERRFGGDDDLRWTWRLGGGIGSSDVSDAAGPVQGGGTFDIHTETSVEPFVFGGVGLRMPFGAGWMLHSDLTLQFRSMGWEMVDRNSAARGEVSSEYLFGLGLGISKRF